MLRSDQHLTDRQIIMLVDGELPTGERKVRDHLAACWSCRSRMTEIQATIADFVHLLPRYSEYPTASHGGSASPASGAPGQPAGREDLQPVGPSVCGSGFDRRFSDGCCPGRIRHLRGWRVPPFGRSLHSQKQPDAGRNPERHHRRCVRWNNRRVRSRSACFAKAAGIPRVRHPRHAPERL